MSNTYTIRHLVRVSAAFTNSAGNAIDPTAVIIKYKNPSGTVTTKVYDTDAEVVKDSTGNYHIDIDANKAGQWFYYWMSTGTGQAADEESFFVSTVEAD